MQNADEREQEIENRVFNIEKFLIELMRSLLLFDSPFLLLEGCLWKPSASEPGSGKIYFSSEEYVIRVLVPLYY